MRGARRLFVVRHAPAEDSSPRGDAGRALTERGRREMSAAARGLAQLDDAPALIAASPLVRARETADLLAERFPAAARCVLPELAPGLDRAAFATWFDATPDARIAIVGHEPDLSELVAWLIGGGRVHMGKGSVAALTLVGSAARGAAMLDWLLTRKALGSVGARV